MHYFVFILVLQSFCRGRESWLLRYYCFAYVSCIVTINVLWLFLTVPWVSPEHVIVVFPDHTHLLFNIKYKCQKHNQKTEYLNKKSKGKLITLKHYVYSVSNRVNIVF